MGEILKLIFEKLISPLGLPLPWYEEYIILGLIGEVAYHVAFNKTGIWGRGLTSVEKSIMHWMIRLPIYVVLCLLSRFIIWACDFVDSHKIISIVIAVIGVLGIISIEVIKYRRNIRLQKEEYEDEFDDDIEYLEDI